MHRPDARAVPWRERLLRREHRPRFGSENPQSIQQEANFSNPARSYRGAGPSRVVICSPLSDMRGKTQGERLSHRESSSERRSREAIPGAGSTLPSRSEVTRPCCCRHRARESRASLSWEVCGAQHPVRCHRKGPRCLRHGALDAASGERQCIGVWSGPPALTSS